ncbi:hypothetical protein ACQ4PT_022265 [Festuca glaucescens]
MAQVAAQLLPDDILACVLRGLAPRSLAASRCVCKRWCAVIDDRRLLRTDLLPLSLYGIFFMEQLYPAPPKFIANPMTRRKIAAADFDYVEYDGPLHIKDHCNGLLLLRGLVVADPATQQSVCLPPPLPPCAGMEDFYDHMCLAFDPTVSPHYEVLLVYNVPMVLENTTIYTNDSEWPPSPYPIRVFSSKTWRWEERLLVRRGEPPGTIADMLSDTLQGRRYVVYWKGAVYVHCQNSSIMRITLWDGVYEMIKPPMCGENRPRLYLGKSKKGVYCTLVYNNTERQIQVWLLTELMEWTLKIDTNLLPMVAKFSWLGVVEDAIPGPWILHEGWCDEVAKEALAEDNSEWDFDDGIILETTDEVEYLEGRIYFLGFHPYKEIVFLWVSRARVVAYDFSTSKVQDLGQLHVQCVGDSFPYTPCWIGELFEKN